MGDVNNRKQKAGNEIVQNAQERVDVFVKLNITLICWFQMCYLSP